MKKLIIFTFVAAMLTLSFTGNAQAQGTKTQKKPVLDRSIKPQPGPAPEINIGKYESFELDNGLKVFVVENNKIPRVSYSLIIDYTPLPEGELAGLSDLTGQMLRKGTTTLSKDQLDEEIDFIGANLSTNANGIYASALKKHNTRLLELMSDVLLNPSFDAAELEKIRTQALSGLEAEKNEPSAISNRVGKMLTYGASHPYGESMTEKSVKNINIDQCKAFYQGFFRPQIAYLAIVGDITTSEAKDLISKYFSKWEKKDVIEVDSPSPKMPANNVVALVDRPDAVQTTLSIGYPVDFKPGSPDAIKARVANTILGGGTFRLYNNLRENKAYTYGAYSRLNADKLAGRFMVSTEIRNSVTDSAINEILFEMKRIREEDVPLQELDLVKNYLSGAFALSLEEPQTVANFAINTARYDLPSDYYVNYLKNLAAVTSGDVKEMAVKYIKPDNSYILAVGKASEITTKLSKFTGGQAIRYFDYEGKEYDPNKKVTPAPAGLTAEAVNKAYISAIGGEKALLKIKDITMMASTSMQGMTIGFDIYRKAPDKYMMKIGAGDMVFQQMAYDGTTAKLVSPMGGENKTLEGKELEDMKYESVLNPELQYEKMGIKLKLEGIEVVNEAETYRVLVTYPTGKETTRFFDVKSGLLVRESGDQGISEFADYREVNGVKFPFMISQQMGPQTMKLNVLSVKLNSKLKDEIFTLK
ncbi:MAG: peptidase M16 [Bacteroidetes bacterium HGW-Bacteroidetes-9]|jgi:predicted Zn-dependent peptidase|nr:MAG: peptidase M16 [Bacteroidetes bacterium HGW-Bacteroidetes-9]